MSRFTEIKARVDALRGLTHTPGPWYVSGRAFVCGGNPDIMIADTRCDRPISLWTEANATFIAAAPEAVADRAEMVALVEEMRDVIAWRVKKIDDYPIGVDERNWMRSARAALAKVLS